MSKKIVKALALIFVLILWNQGINAKIDFAGKMDYYQNLCAKKSSYKANKKTCRSFESFLAKQQNKISANESYIKANIDKTKGDINKIQDLIKKNEQLIIGKKSEIKKVKKDISISKKQIKELEDDLMARLVLLQEINTDNFVIDFLTASTDLDDFLTKLSGIDTINKANDEVITDLSDQKVKLVKNEKQLKKDEVSLNASQKNKNVLLKQYRSQEADLFERLAKERNNKADYNTALDGLDLDQLDNQLNNDNQVTSDNDKSSSKNNNSSSNGGGSSKPGSSSGSSSKPGSSAGSGSSKPSTPSSNSSLALPVSHATVTATAWYYPASFGGGWHPGVDLANRTGTAIKSPGKGVILMRAYEGGGYGNYMVTAHQVGNDTYTFLYGHMSKRGSSASTISKGQTIGSMGSTGNSTGPHLHLEVFKHKGQKLSQVVSKFKKNGDISFGLGYYGTSRGVVSRLQPQKYFGLRYNQVF